MSAAAPTLPDDQLELAEFLVELGAIDGGNPGEAEILGDPQLLKAGILKFARNETGPRPTLPSPGTYTCLAGLAYAVSLHAEAVALADRAIALGDDGMSPGPNYARVLKARALLASGGHKKAIGVLDEALKHDPNLAVAWLMKARALAAREMPERALDSYKEAFAALPSPEALIEAGGCWLALGEQEKADKIFAEARSRFASESTRVVTSVRSLAADARAHRLQGVLKGLLRSFAEDAAVWTEMARLYRDLKEPDRAVRCFEKALALGAEQAVRTELDAASAEMRDRLRCPACNGSGDCAGCKDGTCGRCFGEKKCGECDGKGACPTCEGSEECPACAGKGKVGLMTRCGECDGNGDCGECEDGKCPSCGDRGDCPGCAGGGKCVECGGVAKCRICKGSGIARTAS